MFLAAEASEKTLNAQMKTTIVYKVWALSQLRWSARIKPWREICESSEGCQMFTHFSKLFALSAGRQSAHSSLPAGLQR